MKVDNPAALRFILQDDIYLLKKDKTIVDEAVAAPIAEAADQPVAEPIAEPPVEAAPEPVIETPVVKLSYLGKHQKDFLILVHYPGHEFIADDHLTALENILKRKDHAIDDVAILNMATSTIADMDGLITYFSPVKVLIMGKDAMPAKMEAVPFNQPKQAGSYMALYSFSFDDMMSSTENKKAFWDQMKNL